MTGTKKSKPIKPARERVFSKRDPQQTAIAQAPNRADKHCDKPSSTSKAVSEPSAAQITRHLLQELEELHHSLDAALPKATLVTRNTQEHHTPDTKHPRTIVKDQPEQPEPTVKSKTSNALHRGAKEVQTCLFDEPQPEPQANSAIPEQTKPASKPVPEPEIDQLVDDLVAQYLPRIEQRLRQELKRLLDK